ncbi:collagen-like protein [Spirosoma sp. BT702]|uniref:Collagen-like protein n=1 Tax=Spirosoma profusum TaxID=2771354 RepID=A0A926XY63_9BACT|nr:collagen-like protein [Spirosoma profusum]MBD2702969.1 collagen-like protein [Spirosoma profusum]
MKSIQAIIAAFLLLSIFTFQGCKPKDGEPGPAGTANVQYSDWITVNFTSSINAYTASLTAAPITQDVLDKADIRIYWKNGDYIVGLPYAQNISGTVYTLHQRIFVGKIELTASYSLTAQQFRYVVIPGGAPIGGRKTALDPSDYEAVRKAYNIPD